MHKLRMIEDKGEERLETNWERERERRKREGAAEALVELCHHSTALPGRR